MHENQTTQLDAGSEEWHESGAPGKGENDQIDARDRKRDEIFVRWATEMKDTSVKRLLTLFALAAAISAGATACQSGQQNLANGSATDSKAKMDSATGEVAGDSSKTAGRTDTTTTRPH